MKFAKIDQFESAYMAKFRALVAQHGVLLQTEKDRAAFDLGMIPTQDIGSGSTSLVNPTSVWFQLKGVAKSTASAEEIAKAQCIKVIVKREHLHFWHYYDSPIYLVVYAEATDQFYFMNMKRWIKEQGVQSILQMSAKTKTIPVPTHYTASPATFDMIRRDAHERTVAGALAGEAKDAKMFLRDDAIIWRLNTLKARKREMRVRLIKYGSKMRSEVHFDERDPAQEDWEVIRQHWQYAMGDLSEVFPYLDFKPVGPLFQEIRSVDEEGHEHSSLERVDEEELFWDEDDQQFEDGELLGLPDGTLLQGSGSFEMFEFDFVPSLNSIGQQWASTLKTLIACGVLTVSTEPDWISVAPWNKAL